MAKLIALIAFVLASVIINIYAMTLFPAGSLRWIAALVLSIVLPCILAAEILLSSRSRR